MPSKNNEDYYWVNCFHSFRINNKLESLKKICKNKDFCGVAMPSEDTKMLEFDENQKSDNTLYIIYADLEFLIKEVGECKNNPEKPSTKNQMKIFHQLFQYLQYCKLNKCKISMIHTDVKIA